MQRYSDRKSCRESLDEVIKPNKNEDEHNKDGEVTPIRGTHNSKSSNNYFDVRLFCGKIILHTKY